MNTAKCPHCAVWLAVPDECLGVRDRCPGCGGRFRVVANTEEVLVETIDFPDEWLRVPAAGARVDEPLTAELVDEPHAAVPRSPAPRATESEPAATPSEPSATPNTRTAGPWQRVFVSVALVVVGMILGAVFGRTTAGQTVVVHNADAERERYIGALEELYCRERWLRDRDREYVLAETKASMASLPGATREFAAGYQEVWTGRRWVALSRIPGIDEALLRLAPVWERYRDARAVDERNSHDAIPPAGGNQDGPTVAIR